MPRWSAAPSHRTTHARHLDAVATRAEPNGSRPDVTMRARREFGTFGGESDVTLRPAVIAMTATVVNDQNIFEFVPEDDPALNPASADTAAAGKRGPTSGRSEAADLFDDPTDSPARLSGLPTPAPSVGQPASDAGLANDWLSDDTAEFARHPVRRFGIGVSPALRRVLVSLGCAFVAFVGASVIAGVVRSRAHPVSRASSSTLTQEPRLRRAPAQPLERAPSRARVRASKPRVHSRRRARPTRDLSSRRQSSDRDRAPATRSAADTGSAAAVAHPASSAPSPASPAAETPPPQAPVDSTPARPSSSPPSGGPEFGFEQ
jgi:hypothetical protein